MRKNVDWMVVATVCTVLSACTLTANGPRAEDDESAAGSGGSGSAVSSSGSGETGSSSSTGSGNASTGAGAGTPGTGLDVLGNLDHSMASVVLEELGSASDGLHSPSDVAFHPTSGELWVTNHTADSITIFSSFGAAGQSSSTRYDGETSRHFLANPSGLAFSNIGTMATIHEEDQPTQGNATPADFMGPTLWPSSAAAFDAGHASHLDMLHNSPNAMGIAWESDNAFWVFDGAHASLTLYDFHGDHGPGGSDHTDGEIARYASGQVSRVPGVPSNLVFDWESKILYVADTGNNRIAALDTTTGSRGGFVGPDYDGAEQYAVDGASLTTVIDGAEHGLQQPSGLEVRGGILFVSDHATSTIYGFDMNGTLIDWLDTELPPGCLAGMTLDDGGNIVIADAGASRVLRIRPR